MSSIILKATYRKGFTQKIFQELTASARYKEVLRITTANIPEKPVCVLSTYKKKKTCPKLHFYPNSSNKDLRHDKTDDIWKMWLAEMK